MGTESIGILVYYVLITLFAFFVAAPCLLSTISLFGVQKRFAKVMIEEGVVSAEEVKKYHPKKQIAGVVLSILVMVALIYTCYKTGNIGYLCGILSFTGGVLKYRRVLQFNSITVQRFRNTYKHNMDHKKFNKYVEEHF